MRLRVVNKTRYDTRTLRRLVAYCIRTAGAEGCTRKVTFTYTRQSRGCSGYAGYDAGYVVMRLIRGATDGQEAARVLLHEIDHNLGLHHKDMVKWQTIGLPDFPAELVALTERPAQVKVAIPAEDKRAAKLAQAEGKVKEWQTKVRRTRTWLKKWERRAAYYQRQQRIAASPPAQ